MLMTDAAFQLTISAVGLATMVYTTNSAIDDALAMGTGQYMQNVAQAVNTYVFDNMTVLAASPTTPTNVTAGSVTATVPKPLQPTIQDLIKLKLLPIGFSDKSPLGISFVVNLVPTNCASGLTNCTIPGQMYSTSLAHDPQADRIANRCPRRRVRQWSCRSSDRPLPCSVRSALTCGCVVNAGAAVRATEMLTFLRLRFVDWWWATPMRVGAHKQLYQAQGDQLSVLVLGLAKQVSSYKRRGLPDQMQGGVGNFRQRSAVLGRRRMPLGILIAHRCASVDAPAMLRSWTCSRVLPQNSQRPLPHAPPSQRWREPTRRPVRWLRPPKTAQEITVGRLWAVFLAIADLAAVARYPMPVLVGYLRRLSARLAGSAGLYRRFQRLNRPPCLVIGLELHDDAHAIEVGGLVRRHARDGVQLVHEQVEAGIVLIIWKAGEHTIRLVVGGFYGHAAQIEFWRGIVQRSVSILGRRV